MLSKRRASSENGANAWEPGGVGRQDPAASGKLVPLTESCAGLPF